MIGKLVLWRHAHSYGNLIYKGREFLETDDEVAQISKYTDATIPLSQEGLAQAQNAAQELADLNYYDFRLIVHSGFTRSRHTAQIIHSKFPSAILKENSLIRERCYGCLTFMNKDMINKSFPFLSDYLATVGTFYAYLPGGESMYSVIDRAKFFLGSILHRPELSGHDVLVVGHGQSIFAMKGVLCDWSLEQYEEYWVTDRLSNCGAHIFERSVDFRRLKFVKTIKPAQL